ncbi:hypothetical protein VP01_2397g1 [Puccinia sorghi]|uniref:Uncharacterized protein n=1 Tax=Puccinia sorghi TaxID=27349 RepID=A0A0L6V7H5_9BASI|nr:hypothetical protein VP01_2397g1 [Puccinia sorghi]
MSAVHQAQEWEPVTGGEEETQGSNPIYHPSITVANTNKKPDPLTEYKLVFIPPEPTMSDFNASSIKLGIITALGYKNLDNYILAKNMADMIASPDYKQKKKQVTNTSVNSFRTAFRRVVEVTSNVYLLLLQFSTNSNFLASKMTKLNLTPSSKNWKSSCVVTVSQAPASSNTPTANNKKRGKCSGYCWHLHPKKCIAFHEVALERVKSCLGPRASLSVNQDFQDSIILDSGASSHFLKHQIFTNSPPPHLWFLEQMVPHPRFWASHWTIKTFLGLLFAETIQLSDLPHTLYLTWILRCPSGWRVLF